MIGYIYGSYDTLRAEDLQKLDREIQISKRDGAECFGLGIYDDNLCEALGFGTPLKKLEDRMKIMEQIRGVDFVFSLPSLQKEIIKNKAEEGYKEYKCKQELEDQKQENKKYEMGYAPGTYDLFHMGHLENLTIAASQCKRLVLGVKSDELVREHKNREPVISAEERMEILRHFKFVYGVYQYYTRNLQVANEWIEGRYGRKIDAVFLGSDLRNDFADTTGLKIVYTPRDPELMKTRSTTAYRKLFLGTKKGKYTGNILKEPHSVKNNEMKDTKEDDQTEV